MKLIKRKFFRPGDLVQIKGDSTTKYVFREGWNYEGGFVHLIYEDEKGIGYKMTKFENIEFAPEFDPGMIIDTFNEILNDD